MKPKPPTPAIDDQIMDTFMEGVAMEITPQQFLTKLKASLNKFYAEEMLKLLDDIDIPKTDCAEFYVGAMDSCEPDEHHYRSGRFDAQMEIRDKLKQEIKDRWLGGSSNG